MADDRQTRLRQLFDAALELPRESWPAFVARECGADAELAARLRALLDAARDEHFLGHPETPAVSGAAAALGEQPGDLIGAYRLLQQIGEGGFGTVWMADQREPVRRRVALKILKLGMDTRQVVARFEQEREALALMDHPNIAKVLDAGATAAGRPYFAMELVDGVPVLDYCDRERLDLRARLALFVDICRAIQHAHQKGIIHRDIKPSNVLVTLHDDQPVPKVIDFGIAKATHAELTARTFFTEHRQMIGTPAYMSPEQAELSGLDIDTRTDVYSLGVLLYEMLTGTTPFDIRSLLERGFDEMLRTIREVEPHRPSTRVSSLGASASQLANRRKLDVRRLGVLLRGDLDWIVMRCLEKDRERRYETANGLALDIVRFLQGDAVMAAPPSALYRLRKVVRRNRGTVASGAVIAAALLAGLAGTLWQSRVAARERDAAHQSAAQAAERAAQLEQVARFQERMLGDIDVTSAGAHLMKDLRSRHSAALASSAVPEERRAERSETFASELARVNATDAAVEIVESTILAPAVAAVAAEFADQPGVGATLRQSLANIFTRLGRYEEADALQSAALKARQRSLGAEHPDTLRSLNDSAHLLEMRGRYAEAEPLYRAALAGRLRALGAEHADTIAALGNLAGNLRFQGKLSEAEPLAREALELSRRVLGREQRDTLVRTNVLGYTLVDQGKLAEAEPYWREAYETGKRVLGAADRDALVWTNNLGGLIGALGRRAESEALYREALEGARAVYGEEHPFTLTCMSNVASALRSQARLAEAESLSRDVLERRRRLLGDDHPDTLSSVGSLGAVLRDEGKLAEAEVQLRAVLDGQERTLGREHPATLQSAAILAAVLASLARTAEAEQLYLRTLDAPPSVWGEEHPDRLIALNNLGNLYLQQKRLAEAEPLLRKAFETRQRVSGAEHPETLVAQSGFARVLEDQGKRAEAEALYRDATEKFRRVLGPEHPNTLSSLGNIAGVLLAQQRYAEAEPFYREALAGFERVLGANHARTGSTRRGLGRTLAALERFAEAEQELLEAERALSAAQGVPPERVKACRESLVELYEAWELREPGQGHGAEAERWRAR